MTVQNLKTDNNTEVYKWQKEDVGKCGSTAKWGKCPGKTGDGKD